MGPETALDMAIKLVRLGLFLYQEGQNAAQDLPRDSTERAQVERMNQELRQIMYEALRYTPRPDNTGEP